MGYVIGATLALVIGAGARAVHLDRDRAFYPVVLIVIASYYVLFAVMAGSSRALIAELAGMVLFAALAVIGFRTNPWLVAAGLIGHGVFDFFHASIIVNAGVPAWWPPFCLGYDVVAGAFLAMLLRKPAMPAAAHASLQ